jgi:hypothetical protein
MTAEQVDTSDRLAAALAEAIEPVVSKLVPDLGEQALEDTVDELADAVADSGLVVSAAEASFDRQRSADLVEELRKHVDAQVRRAEHAEAALAERDAVAAVARVEALLDPDAEMATWVVGHRYFEEADIRRALDGGKGESR